MTVLTSQQTSAAVRALLYFGVHDYNGEMDLGDCRASISSRVSPISPPTKDKDMPVEEAVEAVFANVSYQGQAIEGAVRITAKVRWPNLYERMKIGSAKYQITQQPVVVHERLTRNCLVAFSRLIAKHADELKNAGAR